MTSEIASFQQALAGAQVRSGTGDWAEAARLWQRVVAANPVNGSYWAGLAAARFELADYLAAAEAYHRVLDLGVRPAERDHEMFPGDQPYLIPGEVAYSIACCYARLGEADEAIGALGAALDKGFRDLDRPQSDEHWKPLLADQRVRDMLGIIDAAALSRDDAWRADLAFLAREIARRAYSPFGQVTREQFSRQVSELDSKIPGLTGVQIMVAMARLMRQLGDGHAWVAPSKADWEHFPALPLDVYLFDEGVYVTAAAARHRDLLGARIDRVGTHDIAAVLQALDGITSRDNDQQVRSAAPVWLRMPPVLHALGLIEDPGEATLAVTLPDGSGRQMAIPAEPARLGPMPPYPQGWAELPDTLDTPRPLCLRHRELPYWFEHLAAEDLTYFQFNSVTDHPAEPFATFCDRLFGSLAARQPARLVIDMRWNGGGDTFLGQPLLHHLIGCPAINRRGALFVIIGRLTFSAAQNIATTLEQHTHATFVGEPTGSRPNFIGEAVPFELPASKLQVNIGDLYWQTGYPMDHRPWIAPQLYAPPTFESYSKNSDPALAAVLAVSEHLPGFA
jgi:tetratricopeptide (TPR) repeat protein